MGPTLPPEEDTLNKKDKGESSRTTWLLPALVAFGIVALAVGAVVLSANPGGQSSGSDLGQRPYVGGDLHSIAVDPTEPQKVMVGGHDGGAISEDGGKTWEQAAGLEGADPMGWEINSEDPEKMYAGGHPGFYRSEDGGESWEQDNSGLPGTDIHGLGMDPENPQTLYAYVVDEGLYKSTDAGDSRAVGGLRNAVYDLRIEKEQPFLKSVESLVELNRQMTPERRINFTVHNGFPQELGSRASVELVRVLQEALANTRNHSGARQVEVTLRKEGRELWAEVTDDGCGFDTDSKSKGVGLSGMRERVEALGGGLKVLSKPGRGTSVRINLPL